MNNIQSPAALQKTRWVALGLAILTFALFAPALRYDYVDYDDGIYVYANQDVLKGLSVEGVGYAFTSIVGANWMPLTWLSHMFDVTMFGNPPEGPHATNIFLHSLSAAILLLAIQRMTGRLWPSVCVAALFAFHPLRNESIVWVAERKDVLSTLFWMLGLLAYARFSEKPGSKRFAIVALCLLLGLLAKPMLVTFPFALLLLDFWPLKRLGNDWPSFREQLWPMVREKILLFVLIIVFCGVTLWSQHRGGAVNPETSPGHHIAQIAGNYEFYLQKFVLPIRLSILHPSRVPSSLVALAIGLALTFMTAFTICRARQQPWLVTGWLWFLGTLVPVIGIVHVGHISVAERYSYVPSIGLSVIVVWFVLEIVNGKIWLRRASIVLAVLATTACAIATRVDLPRWKNSLSLFEAAVKVAPHPIAYNNIAVHYLDHGQFELAIDPLNRALEMDPNYVKAYINRVTAFQRTGRTEEAKRDLERLVKISPHDAEGFGNRADVLLDLQRYDEAIADFTEAIKLSPNSARAFNNRASACFMKGNFSAAIADCSKALELDPKYANAFNTRGNAYNRTGNLTNALADYEQAISLMPNDPLAYNNLAAIQFKQKDYHAALENLRRCQQCGGHSPAALVEAVTRALNQSPASP